MTRTQTSTSVVQLTNHSASLRLKGLNKALGGTGGLMVKTLVARQQPTNAVTSNMYIHLLAVA